VQNLKDFRIIVEKQYSYVKKVLLSRSEHFFDSFKNSIFEGEQTAEEVFIHGITPVYNLLYKLVYDDINKPIPINQSDLNRPGQYIELYEKILHLLEKAEKNLSEEDLNEKIAFPFNPKTRIIQRDWIGLNIMHMLTHIGQALRLQSLYLRNKL
jgi:hypothetical protein